MEALAAYGPLILIFVLFWFILIRPQQVQQRKRREMLASLKKNDKVITIGGIHGTITDIKDDDITLRVADKVEIKITRNGIGQVKGRKD